MLWIVKIFDLANSNLLFFKSCLFSFSRATKLAGSVASIFVNTPKGSNLSFGYYDAISIAKFLKVEALSLAPTICFF